MPQKTVLILANSVRHSPNACVAGREVQQGGGQRGYVGWVRPISNHGDGELGPAERRLTAGREVQVLDIVRIPVAAHVPNSIQPENWRIDGTGNWIFVERATIDDLRRAAECPPNLWDDPQDQRGSILAARAPAALSQQSLYLIGVPRVVIRLSSENYPERTRKHRRAIFEYNGTYYDLGITDPTIETRYGIRVPTPSEAAVEKRIDHECFLCLSVTFTEFKGRHYKLVAAIIDPALI